MRDAFSDVLVALGRADERVLLLTGDHGYALFDPFRAACPDQFINCGVAEQNMVGMAAGLARMGFRPIVYGLAAFIPVRVLEQIKIDIAHDQLPVILIGDGAGFVYSSLGTSHQSLEDIACTRSIPHLQVLSPADGHEMRACLQAAYATEQPAYLRMGKADRGDCHAGPIDQIDPGMLLPVQPGRPGGPLLLATGSMVSTALALAHSHLPDAAVWSVPWLKPIDAPRLLDLCESHQQVITLEEHFTMGGLGSLVCEVATTHANPVRVLRLGVEDRFSEHCGSYDYLLEEHGLSVDRLWPRIAHFLEVPDAPAP